MTPLKERHVLRQIPLAHPAERPQEVPQPRPQALLRVAMDLTYPIPVAVERPRPFRPRVIDRPMDPTVPLADAVVPVPLVGVHRRLPQSRVVNDLVQLAGAGRLDPLQPHLPRLPPDHAGDRWPVGLEGAVTPPAIGAPPRRVVRIVVRDAFF